MEHKKGYRKSTKGGAGAHGVDYQINILTLLLLEAYKNEEDFRLSTENDEAGKFDDVVLETTETTILLQAKHKMDPKKSLITYNEIFPSGKNKNDFNIFKYIKSFADMKNNFKNLDALILCTNTDIKNDIKQIVSEKTMLDSHIFSFSDKKCYYKFDKPCKDLNRNEEDTDLFLQKFQLISVSDQDIDNRIKVLARDIDIFDEDLDQSLNILKGIVKLCLESEKGIYLTRSHVDAVRSEFFIKKLDNYKVNFKINLNLELHSKYICYYIKNKNNINIHLLKIYQQIKGNRVLIVPPFDNGILKEKVILSFRIEYYDYLIIVVFKEEFPILRDVIRKIAEQVSGKSYKRFIFVSDDTEILESLVKYLKVQAHVFKETISFDQLTVETKKDIFSKNILCKLINNDNINIFEYENKINYYVTRTLRSKTTNLKRIYTENDLCNVIVEGAETIFIIDGPGMGKTTLLSNLQKILIEKYNYLIIKINLNKFRKIFKTCLQNKQILEELLNCNKFDDFEKLLFNLPKKVVILFDAFDEISPNYSELVLNLIKYCEDSPNVKKVVVTSRKHCENDISDKLKIFRFSLEPFSIENQQHFLKDYWTKNPNLTNNEDIQKCEEFIRKLLTKIRNTIGIYSWNPIGIPLQSQMLAEIFKNDCSEYIKSNNFKAESLEKFNIAKLYEQFINAKKNIYIDEKTNVNYSISVSDMLNEKFDRAIDEDHTKMALKVVFDKSAYKHFKILEENSDVVCSTQNFLEIGIVQMSGDYFEFIHRTFAEYLAAKYICNFFNQPEMEESFSDFLISEVFSHEKYSMPRSFMDGILEDRSIPEKILKSFGKKYLPLTRLKNNLLNLARSRQYNLLKIMLKERAICISQVTPSYYDLFIKTLSNFSIFKMLLDKGADIRKIYFNGKTVLHLAAANGSEEVINYLINKNLIDDFYARDDEGNSPLHSAAANNSTKAVKILSKIVSNDIKNNLGKSPLFSACERDAVDVLPILIQANFDINNGDSYNNFTPFISACFHKSFRCINYLLANGADITATDEEGFNGLHHLANIRDILDFKELYIETMNKILLKKCIDVNSKTNHGMTALHYASHEDNVAMASLLVNNKAELEIKNNDGATSLLLACSKKSLNCVKYLIEVGADVTKVDNKGRNALHCLAIPIDTPNVTIPIDLYKDIDRPILNGSSLNIDDKITEKDMLSTDLYKDIIRRVLNESSIDINGITAEGMTAMHLAIKGENLATLEILLENGADKEIKDNKGRTPFILACSEQDTDNTSCNILHLLAQNRLYNSKNWLEIIRQLIDRNCIYLNSVCGKGMTALHHAIKEENFEFLKILLEHGADKEIKDNKGRTPFFLACSKKAFDCAKYLLENGANINEADNKTGCNVLHLLVQIPSTSNNWLQITRQLIDRNCIDLNSVCGKGMTAMHHAIQEENFEILKKLLEHGANKEIKDNNGRTPFLSACSEDAYDCAKFLLERGANINETDNTGCNALHLLAKKGLEYMRYDPFINIFRLLSDRNCINLNSVCGEGMTVMHHAVKKNNLEMVQILLEYGADKEIKDNNGRTSFLLACSLRAFDCATFLLEKGANINETENSGCNALHLLAKPKLVFFINKDVSENHINIFRQLVDRNCTDLNSVCGEGMTAMHHAVKINNPEMVQILLEHGADKEIKNSNGKTPFLLACSEDTIDCAIFLLENDANINETDNSGCNALHLLANSQLYHDSDWLCMEITRQLIDRKCIDLNSVCGKGMTVMHHAVKINNLEMVKILLEHGADKEIKDDNGKTPFLSACSEEAIDCAKFLLKKGANINVTDNSGCNPLHLLAKQELIFFINEDFSENLINIFRQLIDRNCIDLNSVCGEGMTAMHLAVKKKNLEVVQILLERGADKEIKDNNGKTPFLLACSEDAFDCAKYQLENGANINETDNSGCNALHLLSKLVDLTDMSILFVTNLIKLNSINLDDVSNEGLTALQYALRTGNLKMTNLLTQNNDDDVENCGRREKIKRDG